MTRKILWVLLIVLAIIIGLYPGIYFVIDRKFGLLSSKSAGLLANFTWNIAFYTHIILGGIAMLTGWTQFSPAIRNRNLPLHRRVGKVYVIAVLLSSSAAIYIGYFATGGWLASLGFICLGIVWFATTLTAYLAIRRGKIKQHQQMMVFSYAACFAAVTLRIWLPVLQMIFHDFITAYIIVAWLCWLPNMMVASLLTKRIAGNTN